MTVRKILVTFVFILALVCVLNSCLFLQDNTSTTEITIDINKCYGLDGHTFSELCEVIGGNATLNGSMLTISGQTSIIVK